MISFVVHGEPIPYLRMTQGQLKLMRIPDHKLRPAGLRTKQRIRRYFDYKSTVFMACQPFPFSRTPKEKLYLRIMLYFGSRRHGDADNFFKAIADSLFINDKYIVGSMDFRYDARNPRVEIEIQEV